jgi:hypothetical protein
MAHCVDAFDGYVCCTLKAIRNVMQSWSAIWRTVVVVPDRRSRRGSGSGADPMRRTDQLNRATGRPAINHRIASLRRNRSSGWSAWDSPYSVARGLRGPRCGAYHRLPIRERGLGRQGSWSQKAGLERPQDQGQRRTERSPRTSGVLARTNARSSRPMSR